MKQGNKKKQPKTLREYKKWRNLHIGLKAAVYPLSVSPFAIELIANWNTWFPANKDNTSIGIGLALALVTTFISVFAVIKKDSELMKKIGPFVALAFGMILWGSVAILLSTVLMELGKLLIFSGCGIIAAAVDDAVDKAVVKEKYEFTKALADEAGFTKRGKWQNEAKKQAEYDKEKYEQEYEFIPHD